MPEIYRPFYRRLSRALLACDPIPIRCRYCEDESDLHGATQQDIDNLWGINSLPSLDTKDSVREGVTCPKCGIRFSTETKNLWSGKRHLTMRCGARLILLPRPDDLHDNPLPVPRKSAWE